MTNFFEFSLITGSRRDDTSPKLHACGRLRIFINATISHIIKVTASAGVRSKHIGNDVVIATVIMEKLRRCYNCHTKWSYQLEAHPKE